MDGYNNDKNEHGTIKTLVNNQGKVSTAHWYHNSGNLQHQVAQRELIIAVTLLMSPPSLSM